MAATKQISMAAAIAAALSELDGFKNIKKGILSADDNVLLYSTGPQGSDRPLVSPFALIGSLTLVGQSVTNLIGALECERQSPSKFCLPFSKPDQI